MRNPITVHGDFGIFSSLEKVKFNFVECDKFFFQKSVSKIVVCSKCLLSCQCCAWKACYLFPPNLVLFIEGRYFLWVFRIVFRIINCVARIVFWKQIMNKILYIAHPFSAPFLLSQVKRQIFIATKFSKNFDRLIDILDNNGMLMLVWIPKLQSD